MQVGDIPFQVVDMLSDPIAVLDRDGLVVYSNEPFKALEMHSDPGQKGTWKRLPDLIPEASEAVDEHAPRQMALSLEGKSFTVLVYPLNRSGDKGVLYFALLKLSKEQEAALAIHRGTPGISDKEQWLPPEELLPEFGELKGEEPVFKKALLAAQKAARTDFPVLILGESGTGKEILARTIHKASRRSTKDFVDINCAAIPENLIESELFGYEKGAFTGAGPKGRRGLFEDAHEGSIFLDEIGDASLQIQSKVLRVLQEGRFKRVGGNRNIEVDVRLISATNRDLSAFIGEGKFREDLYYRLNTITIELPPLRRRPNDITLLIEHFLTAYARRQRKRVLFSADCIQLMESYRWPGNVRELKGVVDYAVTMATDSLITPDCLPSFLLPQNGFKPADPPRPMRVGLGTETDSSLPAAVEQVEKELIRRVLEKSASRTEAIKTLGISRRTFYIKIKQYGLE